ncbi:MAG TPA: hypothetical protein DEP72_07815, partial [Clostridiales bacterium]|nr:hypothetical protein [Clostridiales bacterium]
MGFFEENKFLVPWVIGAVVGSTTMNLAHNLFDPKFKVLGDKDPSGKVPQHLTGEVLQGNSSTTVFGKPNTYEIIIPEGVKPSQIFELEFVKKDGHIDYLTVKEKADMDTVTIENPDSHWMSKPP